MTSAGRVRLALATLLALSALARAQGDPRFTEHAIASVPKGVEIDGSIEFAPDGSHVAYVGSRGGKPVPVIDAKTLDSHWFVDHPRFGAEGRVAFRVAKPPAKRVHASWLLLDGKRLPGSEGVDTYEWSPDGTRLAFVANPECRIAEDGSREGECILVIDGRKGARWHVLSPPVWSPDSKHVLAVAEAKGKYCVLLDNRPIAEGSRYDGPAMSADGSRIAYASELPVNGALAADPARIKWFVACGDARLGLDFEAAGSPVFGGNRIAFKAAVNGRVGVSIDGAPAARTWRFVKGLLLSGDGTRVAFAASEDCTVPPGAQVTRMGEDLVFGGAWQLVLDGKPTGGKFAAIGGLAFSRDSKRLAFRARAGAKWRVVCGTLESAEFDFVGPPQFSPDGTRIAFGVLAGREFAWKVIPAE